MKINETRGNVIVITGTSSGKATLLTHTEFRAWSKLWRMQRHGSRKAKVEVRRTLARVRDPVRALEAALDKRARRRRAKLLRALSGVLTASMMRLQAKQSGPRLNVVQT